MPIIHALGEVVYDIIFKNNEPQHATPGGSVLNTCISLGGLRLPVVFHGNIAHDRIGRIIREFVKGKGVQCSDITTCEGNSNLALAFLNENNDAEYLFYRRESAVLNTRIPQFKNGDYFLFGSQMSLTPNWRQSVELFLKEALQKDIVCLFDPNIRPVYLEKNPDIMSIISKNIKIASIVKASVEDFTILLGTSDENNITRFVHENGCSILILTDASKPVTVYFQGNIIKVPVDPVNPVSSIGAGDAFNAGILYYLYTKNINADLLKKLTADHYSQMVNVASAFAAAVCMRKDNYLPEGFIAP